MLRLYGQGLGDVQLDFGSYKAEETRDLVALCLDQGGETFARSFEGVQRIAQNTTWGFHQHARVSLYKEDETSLAWAAFDPKGRRIMNGAIVNHGARTGGHDWSRTGGS